MSFTARQYVTVTAMILAFAAAPRDAFSQAIVGGQTALDNAASAGARSPGDMVSAGVAQALAFGDRGAAGTVTGSCSLVASVAGRFLVDR